MLLKKSMSINKIKDQFLVQLLVINKIGEAH